MPPFRKPKPAYNYKIQTEKEAVDDWFRVRKVPRSKRGHLLLASWNIANLGSQKRTDKDLELIAHMLKKIGEARDRPMPQLRNEVVDLLERYSWPGNVRQLENTLQRLVVLAGEAPITREVVDSDSGLRRMLLGDEGAATPVYSLEETEKEQILTALEAANGNKTRAAKMLGISRATIFRKIKEYDLT